MSIAVIELGRESTASVIVDAKSMRENVTSFHLFVQYFDSQGHFRAN
jgi:hypothetical protein